jgi:hypothetical protein
LTKRVLLVFRPLTLGEFLFLIAYITFYCATPYHVQIANIKTLQRIPIGFARSCRLDPSSLWFPCRLYLGSLPLRCRRCYRHPLHQGKVIRRILRLDFHHWQWPRLPRNCRQSLHHRYVPSLCLKSIMLKFVPLKIFNPC